MGHLQRLSNWNVRRAITRHRTAQVLDAISYYNRAKAQSNNPEVYDGILSHLASLAEISELTEGVSMLNVHHAFRSLRTECSLIDGDVPVHVPLLAALVSAPTSVNPAAAELRTGTSLFVKPWWRRNPTLSTSKGSCLTIRL